MPIEIGKLNVPLTGAGFDQETPLEDWFEVAHGFDSPAARHALELAASKTKHNFQPLIQNLTGIMNFARKLLPALERSDLSLVTINRFVGAMNGARDTAHELIEKAAQLKETDLTRTELAAVRDVEDIAVHISGAIYLKGVRHPAGERLLNEAALELKKREEGSTAKPPVVVGESSHV